MASSNYRSQQLLSGTGPVHVTFGTQGELGTPLKVSRTSQAVPFPPVSGHIQSDALADMQIDNGLFHLVDPCVRMVWSLLS